jgi:CHAD domain-containing protein
MDPFYKMDIFFVVATAAVAVVALCMCVVLVYLAKLLKTLDRIATEVEEETEEIRGDLHDMRLKMRRSGTWFVPLLSFFGRSAKRLASGKKRKKRES